MTARSISSRELIGSLTASFLTLLPTHAGKIETTEAKVVQEQTLDLVALSVAAAIKGEPILSQTSSLVILKLRAAIDAGLADPGLVPSEAAEAAGVSVRYANALLAKQGTSLARLIQTCRLERCRKLLEEPLQAHRSVSEIAFSWGFSDLSYFGRSFKKAFLEFHRENTAIEVEVGGAACNCAGCIPDGVG